MGMGSRIWLSPTLALRDDSLDPPGTMYCRADANADTNADSGAMHAGANTIDQSGDHISFIPCCTPTHQWGMGRRKTVTGERST